jgi:O-antigen/teichoic acid export membrane protein
VRLGREVLRHSAVYSGTAILEKIVGLVLLPFYARIFETSGYGLIGMVDTAVGVLATALYAGYYNAIVTTYHEEPLERRGRVMSTATLLQFGLSAATVPIPALVSPWLSGVLLGDSSHYGIIILALATMVIELTGKTASSELLIRRESVVYSVVALLRFVAAIALNILLVLVLRVGVIGIFISSFIAASLSASIFLWMVLRKNGTAFDRQIARKLLTFQLPIVPAELIHFTARQAERVLVRIFVSLEGVGILEMAYKFPPLLNWLVVGPFMMVWRTKSVEIGRLAHAPYAMGRMLTNMIFVMLFTGILLAVDIRPLIMLLTPEPFWRAASIARIEILTTVLAGVVAFMEFGLIYRKWTGRLAFIRITVALGKVALGLMLIGQFGLGGAAYAALVMETITLAWLFQQSQKAYTIHIETGRILLLLTVAFALCIFIIVVEHLPSSPSAWVAHHILPTLRDVLQRTPLAGWRGGKLIALMDKSTLPFATLLVNTTLAATYGLMVFIVLPEGTVSRLLGGRRNAATTHQPAAPIPPVSL